MARVLRVEGLAKYDAAASAEGAVPTLDRLVAILREALGDGANEKFPLVQVANSARGTICFTRGTQERIAAVQAVFDELAKDPPVHVRLQCSLVTLPAAVALEHGLKPNLVKTTDETNFGRLVRAAMQHKGTLGNLPEVTVAPLAPFHLQPAGKPAAKDDRVLRVRGEMVPVSASEVVVRMQLVRGPLPADTTQLPKASVLQPPCFRLAAGGAAMVMIVEGDDAVVLMVRCVGAAHEVPPPTKEK